jgi:hypothetical protein
LPQLPSSGTCSKMKYSTHSKTQWATPSKNVKLNIILSIISTCNRIDIKLRS